MKYLDKCLGDETTCSLQKKEKKKLEIVLAFKKAQIRLAIMAIGGGVTSAYERMRLRILSWPM